MILKKLWVGTLSLAFLALSCGEDTSKQQEEYHAVFKDVMDVHDKLMVRMTDIYEYSKELQKIADTSAAPQPYVMAKERLTKSDSNMMDWMEHFGDEFVKNKSAIKKMNSQQLEAQITDLKEELKQVQDMQTEMTASLASAKELTQ
jgi:hypothetical protein